MLGADARHDLVWRLSDDLQHVAEAQACEAVRSCWSAQGVECPARQLCCACASSTPPVALNVLRSPPCTAGMVGRHHPLSHSLRSSRAGRGCQVWVPGQQAGAPSGPGPATLHAPTQGPTATRCCWARVGRICRTGACGPQQGLSKLCCTAAADAHECSLDQCMECLRSGKCCADDSMPCCSGKAHEMQGGLHGSTVRHAVLHQQSRMMRRCTNSQVVCVVVEQGSCDGMQHGQSWSAQPAQHSLPSVSTLNPTHTRSMSGACVHSAHQPGSSLLCWQQLHTVCTVHEHE